MRLLVVHIDEGRSRRLEDLYTWINRRIDVNLANSALLLCRLYCFLRSIRKPHGLGLDTGESGFAPPKLTEATTRNVRQSGLSTA